MIRRQIKQSDSEENRYVQWNAFIDLIALEDYEDLTDVQRLAHLVFWYDSEVQNGGHLQYFANSSGSRAIEAVEALSELGIECERDILNDAVDYLSRNPLTEFESADDYVEEAQGHAFEVFDQRYYACAKEPNQYLELYLERNLSDFVEII